MEAIKRLGKTALKFLIEAYRVLISPVLPSQCRFTPCCSSYGVEAIQRHGCVKGSYLTLKRLLRCHPWCDGGFDPVP